MDKSRPFVSVIIPTYHDWERLKKCLVALQAQTYPENRFEVVVVNNDPVDPVPEMELPPNFQIIFESKPGSYAARNKGISVAKGDIFAFTDSDCIPREDWIEKAVERLQDGAERVAGHVELFFNAEKLTFAEVFEKAFAFRQELKAAKGTAITANMVVWRRHFDTVGMFNGSLMSGGDIEWGWRAHDLGVHVLYAPDVVVRHPARSTMRELRTKWKRVAVGSANMDKSVRRVLPFRVFRGFMPPVNAFIRLRKRSDLSLYEKNVACCILYYLKIFSTFHELKARVGLMLSRRG